MTWFATPSTVTVFHEGNRYTLPSTDDRFSDIVGRLQSNDIAPADVPTLFSPMDPRVAAIPGIRLRDGYLEITAPSGDTYTLSSVLYRRILEGGPAVDNILAFLGRCRLNPRPEAVLELYDFLEATHLPIDNEGHFYAYKKVRSDLMDIYSGTYLNAPGQVVAIPREDVDPDRDRTCSTGLHFAGYDYLPHYGTSTGTVIVLVRIDPADVVAIPTDYNNQKGRTSRYTVVAVLRDEDLDSRSIERPWIDPIPVDAADNDEEDYYDE